MGRKPPTWPGVGPRWGLRSTARRICRGSWSRPQEGPGWVSDVCSVQIVGRTGPGPLSEASGGLAWQGCVCVPRTPGTDMLPGCLCLLPGGSCCAGCPNAQPGLCCGPCRRHGGPAGSCGTGEACSHLGDQPQLCHAPGGVGQDGLSLGPTKPSVSWLARLGCSSWGLAVAKGGWGGCIRRHPQGAPWPSHALPVESLTLSCPPPAGDMPLHVTPGQ